MPRGRFVSKCISVSEQVNKLIERCGPEAGLFFTWLIPHLDVEGRCVGNPKSLKGMVVPMVDSIDAEKVEKILGVANQIGLLTLYEVDGSRYVQLPKFEEHQLGLQKNRESPSKIPPLDSSRVTQELLQTNSGVTPQKAREGPLLNLTSLNLTSLNLRSKNGASENSDVQAVFNHYKSHHPRSSVKSLPVLSEEYRAIETMLAHGFTVEDCCKAIDGYHNSSFHLGANDNNQKYLALTLIFQDVSHVQKGVEMADSSLESSLLSADEVKEKLKREVLIRRVEERKAKRLTDG